MEIDITIERIDNGYIMSGKGVTDGKHYFKDLETFGMVVIMEDLVSLDKEIKEHEMPKEPFTFKITSSL